MVMNPAINFLLVEDDEVDVKNVQRAFKKNNINNPLFIAGNGEEALVLLRGNGNAPITPPPQVVLLDLNMPKMGGLEFLQEVRKDSRFKSLSIFVLTTSDEERDKIAAYNFKGISKNRIKS
jgi:CheY-like chemotaxis protein